MAVIQVVFKHVNSQADSSPDNKTENFSSLVRRLVVSEANEWQGKDDVVIDWGDPACTLDAPTLALACRKGQPYPLFGRSWIHYHRPSRRVTVGVDQLGLFPIILSEYAGNTYIASDSLALAQLLGAAAEPDNSALIELLAFGQLLGTQAALENATHMDAATVCIIEVNGKRQTYVDTPFVLPRNGGNEDSALEALVNAVDKRFRNDPDTVIPLSGGVDSRLLLAAALAAGHRPETFSFACKNTDHWKIAGEIADVAGTEFFMGGASPQHFAAAQNSVAQLGGGEVALHQGYLLACPELIAHTRGTTLLTTTGAEVFQGVYYDKGIPGSEMLGYAGLKSTLLKAMRHYILNVFDKTLQPFAQAFPQLEEELRGHLTLRLQIYQSGATDAAHYFDSVYLGEQMRRGDIAVQQLLGRDYARSHPFMDPEVIEAIAALPVSKRLGCNFQRNAIAKLNPKLAEVRWEKTMRPLNDGLRWDERYASLATYLGFSSRHSPQQKFCLEEMTEWLESFAGSTQILLQALEAKGLSEGEAQQGIRHLLNSRHAGATHSLGILGAYSLWAKYLVGQRAALAA